ncbi:MAG: YdcF family protein [Planctomycetes bacterium]|nr:YdcF family protein [Planctomycetota bacterium]
MYRVIVMLMEPYTFLVVSLLAINAGTWWRQRPRTWLLRLATVVLGVLYVCSMSAFSYFVMWSLEAGYPPRVDHPTHDDIVVVLSAGLILERDDGSRVHLDDVGLTRCLSAFDLYQEAGSCRLLLSGGKVDESIPGPTLAETMRDFFLTLGVKPDDLLLEDRSKSTYENAVFSTEMLSQTPHQRVWLVTSASHMDRAVRCFRKQGLDVTAAPCAHETLVCDLGVCHFLPSSIGLAQLTRATHEWQGRIWYRLRGRI